MLATQKIGGIAAIGAAMTFVVGFWLYFALLIPAAYGSLKVDPREHVAFLVANRSTMYAWNLVIYVVFGVCLVVLALALYQRLKAAAPSLMQSATVFGIIWATLVIAAGMVANIGTGVVTALHATNPAQAATVWLAFYVVLNGLGGGNEIVGGLWVLLVNAAALRTRGLPRPLSWFGLLVSICGLLTAVPALKDLGAAFGLGLIAWFVWVGVVLIRSRPCQPSHSGI